MKKAILLAMFLIIGYSNSMFAQVPSVVISDKPGWHKIGETTVNFKTETDEIMVLGENSFQSVKIKVIDAAINLKSFIIYFSKGDPQTVKIGQSIKSPGETRVVDITGGPKHIKKIVLTYKTVSNSKDEKAHLELWGYKGNTEKKK